MNIRRHIARFAAGAAAISSLAVGFNVQPASASTACEVDPNRRIKVSDVQVVEGNPGWFNITPLRFKVETFGCTAKAASVSWFVDPTLNSEQWNPADDTDVAVPHFTQVGMQGVMSWKQGDTATQWITVPVVRDTIFEHTEALRLQMYWASGHIIAPNGHMALGFILNDDVDPNVPK